MAIEDTLESIVRRRVLAQLEMTNELQATFTTAEDDAVDSICAMVAQVDQPCPLDTIAAADRDAFVRLLHQLPRTHPITRLLEHAG